VLGDVGVVGEGGVDPLGSFPWPRYMSQGLGAARAIPTFPCCPVGPCTARAI
jgi:hypothetical protein